MSNNLEHIAKIYAKNTLLNRLSARSQQLQKLNTLVIESLPPQIRPHCYLANINDNTVVIHTDSASYATLLRFQATSIFRTLSGHLPHIISKLDIRVRPQLFEKPSQTISISMAPHTASIIKQTAENIENQDLKKALEKLAQRAEHEPS